MQRVTPILQVWWCAWLRNWQLSVQIWTLPWPTFWQLKIWKHQCSSLLVVIGLKCCVGTFGKGPWWTYNIGVRSLGWNSKSSGTPACVFEIAFETFWFRHHSHNFIWPYGPSFDFESTSETRNPMPRSIVAWAPLNDWHALLKKRKQNWRMHNKISLLHHELKDCWADCWLENFVSHRIWSEWMVSPPRVADELLCKTSSTNRSPSETLGWWNLLHKNFSAHHVFFLFLTPFFPR